MNGDSELRGLLAEALGWIEDNIPRTETGASCALPGDIDLMRRIAAALAADAPADEVERVPCGRYRRHEVHGPHTFTIQFTDDSPEQGDVWCPGLTGGDNVARLHQEQATRNDRARVVEATATAITVAMATPREEAT